MADHIAQIDSFVALTMGIIVLFAGIKLTARIAFLQKYNIPEPVTGGILASAVAFVLYVGHIPHRSHHP